MHRRPRLILFFTISTPLYSALFTGIIRLLIVIGGVSLLRLFRSPFSYGFSNLRTTDDEADVLQQCDLRHAVLTPPVSASRPAVSSTFYHSRSHMRACALRFVLFPVAHFHLLARLRLSVQHRRMPRPPGLWLISAALLYCRLQVVATERLEGRKRRARSAF